MTRSTSMRISNANTLTENYNVTNTVNGNNNHINAGDLARVTFNGNSNTAQTGNSSDIWFYGASNNGYAGTSSYLDFYGPNNYGSASTGSTARLNAGYDSTTHSFNNDHGWIGPYGQIITSTPTTTSTLANGSTF